jgi:phospholipid-binding lipoprotein MlaA
MQMKQLRMVALSAAMLAASGCSTVQTPSKDDPWEGFNRTVFKVNDKVDRYALKPVAQGYKRITPQPVRDSVTNFFSNIGDVYNVANNLLQLNIADGVSDLMRIVINTVFGVGGLFDVATLAKLPKHNQDLGLTLGHYGVPAGPYLVLPLFGPSTVRDAVGTAGDTFINPITYVNPAGLSWGLYGVNLVSTRANLLGATDLIAGAALDQYSFVRNAYLQRRHYLLTGGSAAPDYETPPPKYDTEGLTDESASAPAAPAGASAVPATPTGASAPSGASAPGEVTVPAGEMVPPTRFNYPTLRLR